MPKETEIGPFVKIEPMPSTVSTMVGDVAILLDMSSATYYELNSVGARIWSLSQMSLGLGEIWTRLLVEFDVEEKALQDDTAHFVDELTALGLARIVHPQVP